MKTWNTPEVEEMAIKMTADSGRVCPQCGNTKMGKGENYCKKCGASLSGGGNNNGSLNV